MIGVPIGVNRNSKVNFPGNTIDRDNCKPACSLVLALLRTDCLELVMGIWCVECMRKNVRREADYESPVSLCDEHWESWFRSAPVREGEMPFLDPYPDEDDYEEDEEGWDELED